MFIKLDEEVIDLLCCPFCKGPLKSEKDKFICNNCATLYPLISIRGGDSEEQIYDFRIHRPSYSIPKSIKQWDEKQKEYEKLHQFRSVIDHLQVYLDEIESVKEVYTLEFHIKGTVLDVGGLQGRLRTFLSDEEVPLYVSVDPFMNAFKNLQYQPNFLKAYPCLLQPCNFLACHAENLPFISNSFDWVHMRSVVDHFVDPYNAFKEAYRVLKPYGKLMIGLAIIEKRNKEVNDSLLARIRLKIKKEGIFAAFKAISNRITGCFKRKKNGGHTFHFKYKELIDLLSITGFEIEKEHWQKPPFSYCIYLSATPAKIDLVIS